MDWLKIMALYLVISMIGGSALMSLFLLCMRLGAGIFWNSVSVTIQNNLKSGAITLAMLSAFPYMVALIINLDEWGSVKWSSFEWSSWGLATRLVFMSFVCSAMFVFTAIVNIMLENNTKEHG